MAWTATGLLLGGLGWILLPEDWLLGVAVALLVAAGAVVAWALQDWLRASRARLAVLAHL